MASATSPAWRAGTFPNGCESEKDWVAAQKRGITWRQLSDPERQAVSLDAVRHKVEDKNWTRAAAADLLKLKTQLHAALQKEEFRQAAELKKKLESINSANWFCTQSGQWRAQPGFDDVNSTVWRDRAC
jgi:hypothetical protein